MREDWVECMLEEIVSKLGDGLHGTPKYSDNGEYFFINGNNLFNGNILIKTNTKKVAKEEFEKYKKTLNDRTILVSINGTIGNLAFYNNEKVVLGKSACYFNLLKDINKEYIRFLLASLGFMNYALKIATGSTIKNVPLKGMRAFRVPLPPLVEQKAIVKKIEALFSSLDSGIADLTKAQEQLKVYRQAVLKKAFEGELTKEWRAKQTNLPTADELLEQIKEERQKHYERQLEDWKKAVTIWEKNGKEGKKPSKPIKTKELVKLSEDEIKEEISIPQNWIYKKIGNVTNSIVPNRDKPKSFNGNIYWVTTPDLDLDSVRINYQHIEKGLTKEECKKYNARIIPVDSVIMTCVGMLGTSSIVEKEIVINQQLHAFLPAPTYEPKYLAYLIRFNSPYLERSSTATTVKYLNKTKCNSLPFPVCTIQEQHQIVREIESRLSVCDQVEKSIKESLDKAIALRQSILKKAFEGSLLSEQEIAGCKAHPAYEPAEVLLGRIRSEKK